MSTINRRGALGALWYLIAAIVLLTACGADDESPLDDLRGSWSQPHPLIDNNDECSGSSIVIDEKTLQYVIGKSTVDVCYRLDRVDRAGSIYTLQLQEIDSLTAEEVQDSILRGVPLRRITCDETAANRSGVPAELIVSVENKTLIVRTAPPSLPQAGSMYGRRPPACELGVR